MTPSPYTEDTPVQQTTADYLERQPGWESVYAHHHENFGPKCWRGRGPMRANSKHASNEYFLPVMDLIFLHLAYSRYLAVKDATTAGLPTRLRRERPVTREDSQKNALYLRPEGRLDHLVARPDAAAPAAAIIAAAERRSNSTP